MQEQHIFEYALIRVMPRVDRGEMLNVGVILFCKSKRFLEAMFQLDEARLTAIFPGIDIEEIKQHLAAFDHICEGNPKSVGIASLDVQSRFKWLTAKRSTVIQTSEVHPGFCNDPAEKLEQLFRQMVLIDKEQ